jgi:hypothetical protein
VKWQKSTGSWRQSAKFISFVEAADTATATKRAIEEFKIGEPWKQARLAAERWHVGNVRHDLARG